MRQFYEDMQRVVLSLLAGPVAIAGLALVCVVSFAYCAGQRTVKQDATIAALVDTVRLRDSVRVVVRDTVTVYRRRVDTVKAESDSLDEEVEIVDDSTLFLAALDSALQLPRVVVADIQALRLTVATQDTLLRWYRYKGVVDSLAIVARDRLREMDRPRRKVLTRWAGIGWDPFNKYAAVSAGATVDVWQGIGADVYIDQPLIRGARAYASVRVGIWRDF